MRRGAKNSGTAGILGSSPHSSSAPTSLLPHCRHAWLRCRPATQSCKKRNRGITFKPNKKLCARLAARRLGLFFTNLSSLTESKHSNSTYMIHMVGKPCTARCRFLKLGSSVISRPNQSGGSKLLNAATVGNSTSTV